MSVLNLKPASTGKYPHRYNPVTVTSLDFGELLPVRVIETVKGDDWQKISAKGFMRIAPSIFPAYGKNMLCTAAFFVSHNQIFEGATSFHDNMNSYKGKPNNIPWIYGFTINKIFFENASGTAPTNPVDPDQWAYLVGYTTDVVNDTTNIPVSVWDYDFIYPVRNNTLGQTEYRYYKLTRYGLIYYKLLKSLGYDFCSFYGNMDISQKTVADLLVYANHKLNLLPLFAYFKVFCDCFLNGNLYNDDTFVSVMHHFHDGEVAYYSGFNAANDATTGEVYSDFIVWALKRIRVPHQRNMYLEAWNSPNSPTGVAPANQMKSLNPDSLISPYSPDITNPNTGNVSRNTLTSQQTGNAIFDSAVTGQGTALQNLSNIGLNLLKSASRFVLRNNLVGSKSLERSLARFGIKDIEWKTEYVSKLFEGKSEVDYSAVMSNTDNASSGGKTLGAYAGFGVAGLDVNFSYKASDFGYIIILSWLQQIPMLVHGVDPSVLRIYPQDFYTPEYDGATLRAIPMCEISQSKKTFLATNAGDKNVYGFTNLYDDLRNMRDSILGDFVTSRNTHDFVFARDLSYFRDNLMVPKPQENRIQYYQHGDNPDLTNPFQLSFQDGDRFYLQFNFDIRAKRNVQSKSSTLDLNGEGDLQMPLGGNSMS